MEAEAVEGRHLWIKLPYGDFVVTGSRETVLFAGGTGVTAFTAFLGFEVNEGEYKVMGMAPYGTPRYLDQVWKLVQLGPDGSFRMPIPRPSRSTIMVGAGETFPWLVASAPGFGPGWIPGALKAAGKAAEFAWEEFFQAELANAHTRKNYMG